MKSSSPFCELSPSNLPLDFINADSFKILA